MIGFFFTVGDNKKALLMMIAHDIYNWTSMIFVELWSQITSGAYLRHCIAENSSASKEDIDNLMLRREVLEAEEESILTSIQQIEQQIRSEHKQIDSIDKEQERIYEQIQDLHLR